MAFKHLFRPAATILFITLMTGFAAADPTRIVALGDSLMAGPELLQGSSFPEKLQAALKAKGYDVTVANAGVSGDTTSDGLARLDWSIPEGTDIVILELGANDMLRGIAPDKIRSNLDAILARLQERGMKVLLCGMYAAPNMGADYAEAFNAIYPDLAGKYAVTFYPFFLEGVATTRVMQLEDGMHPNAAGVDRIVANILPTVVGMLGKRGNGA